MHLTYRYTQPKDLAEAFPLIKDCSFYPPKERARLFSFWKFLLKNRMGLSSVVEDLERPPGKRICAFGMSVFTPDEFVEKARSALAPPLSRRVFESWLKGQRVFLNRKEIAAHNSKGGLNLVVLHYGMEQKPMEEFIALNGKFIESFFYLHSGYQIKEFLTENFTPEDTAITLSHSLFIRRTFPEYGTGGEKIFPHTLVGARREELNSREKMFAFALLLRAQPPRFNFSQGEKDVLERALLGETDQEIARSLHYTVWAVKKRWQGIYEKVGKTNAALFASKDPGGSEENQKVERRRFLLDYLRTHLEEVRPTLKVRKKRK